MKDEKWFKEEMDKINNEREEAIKVFKDAFGEPDLKAFMYVLQFKKDEPDGSVSITTGSGTAVADNEESARKIIKNKGTEPEKDYYLNKLHLCEIEPMEILLKQYITVR